MASFLLKYQHHHHRCHCVQYCDIFPPDLVYDYYAAGWDGPQGRLEVCAIIGTNIAVNIIIISSSANDISDLISSQCHHHQDALVVTNPDYTDEMATSPDYSAQASEDLLPAPPPVKDEFGATLSGMMGALAEIQKKGDSMLAGIRRQREVGCFVVLELKVMMMADLEFVKSFTPVGFQKTSILPEKNA